MNTITSARPASRYSTGAIVFHWLIAALIVFNFVAAWVAEDMSKADAMKVMGNHKAIGITILILSIGRILWRLTHRPPPFPVTMQPWEMLLARITHGLFYFLMIGIPLAGWVFHSLYSGGAPVGFFGLFEYPGLPFAKDPAGGEVAGETHEILATAMLFLAGLHVLGALKHRFVDKDRVMSRMLPGR